MHSKIKRKFISLMLAAILAVSPLVTFPMNVFAVPWMAAMTSKFGLAKTLAIGATEQVQLTCEPDKISSSNSTVATAYYTGDKVQLIANAPGTSTIKLEAGNEKLIIQVTVVNTLKLTSKNLGELTIEFDKDSTWGDIVKKYENLNTSTFDELPGKLLIYFVQHTHIENELKSSNSTNAWNLIDINDKVNKYPLDSYFLS